MQHPGARGFTMVELIFTVVIGLILAAVGVPSFTNLIKGNRISASVNDVVGAYQFARSEAAKRGVPVTLCPSEDSNTADPGCAQGAGWQAGYIAFVDVNGDGIRNGAPETLLLSRGAMPGDIFVNASDTMAGGMTYGGDGFPVGLADSASVLVFCDERGDDRRMRVINVSSTGRPAVAKNVSVPSALTC